MSIRGGSRVTFDRAIAAGHAGAALGAAHELPRPLGLSDALALTCVLRNHRRFEGAAVRWHARLALELPGLSAPEASLALAALAAMPANFRAGARALAELFEAHARIDLVAVLERALAEHD